MSAADRPRFTVVPTPGDTAEGEGDRGTPYEGTSDGSGRIRNGPDSGRVELLPHDHGEEDHDDRLPAVVEHHPPARIVPGTVVNSPWSYAFQGRPIVPAWIIQREQRTAAIRWGWQFTLHGTAFHTVRLPLYGLRLCLYTPRGIGRSAAAWWHWVFDAEGKPIRQAIVGQAHDTGRVEQAQVAGYMSLSRQRNERVRLRHKQRAKT